jgi:tetratricopeptide (TPR) repeat protein
VEYGIRDNLDPERQGRALRNLAKVLSWSGKIDDAARAARSALELLGTDAECEFILGDSETDRGDFEAAIEHYQAAIELESDYTKALNNMGIALSRAGRPNEAITAYQRVLELKPQHRGARFNLANAYLRAGLFEEAAVRYGDIVNANWSDLDAHFNLARAHYGQGKLELAEDHLRVVLGEDPEAQDARQELKLVLNERDRHMLP